MRVPDSGAVWRRMHTAQHRLACCVDMRGAPQHAYLDLGARDYNSSVALFEQGQLFKIPATVKFRIEAWEVIQSYRETYRDHPNVNLHHEAVWIRNGNTTFTNLKMARMSEAEEGESPTHIDGQQLLVQTIDFAEYLKSNFKLEDMVIVKMDVEGAEFQIIPHLIQQEAIRLIDELFVECHYHEWSGIGGDFQECRKFFAELRQAGVYAHEWA